MEIFLPHRRIWNEITLIYDCGRPASRGLLSSNLICPPQRPPSGGVPLSAPIKTLIRGGFAASSPLKRGSLHGFSRNSTSSDQSRRRNADIWFTLLESSLLLSSLFFLPHLRPMRLWCIPLCVNTHHSIHAGWRIAAILAIIMDFTILNFNEALIL